MPSPISRHSPVSEAPSTGATPSHTPAGTPPTQATAQPSGSAQLSGLTRPRSQASEAGETPAPGGSAGAGSPRLRAQLPLPRASQQSVHSHQRSETVEEEGGAAVARLSLSSEETVGQQRVGGFTPLKLAHTLGAETLAKAVASGIHFGATANFTRGAIAEAIGEKLAESHPYIAALAESSATAVVFGASHYLGEIVVRPGLLAAMGAKLEELKPEQLFPNDDVAQKLFKSLQGNSKIGSAAGNAIGLAAFCVVHGIRGHLGLQSEAAATAASAIGGGTMAFGHTLLAAFTQLNGQPTHTAGSPNISQMFKAASASMKTVANKGGAADSMDRIFNTLQDVMVRAGGGGQGMVSSDMLKKYFERKAQGNSPAGREGFEQNATQTFMLLGLAFFANLSLADRRGKTGAPFSGTADALKKATDLKKMIDDGPTGALAQGLGSSVPAQGAKGLAHGVDVANNVVSALLTLPMNVTFDTATLAGHGIQAGAKKIFGSGDTAHTQDQEQGRENIALH